MGSARPIGCPVLSKSAYILPAISELLVSNVNQKGRLKIVVYDSLVEPYESPLQFP